MVVHTFIPADRWILSLRLVLIYTGVPGHPGIHRQTLFQKAKQNQTKARDATALAEREPSVSEAPHLYLLWLQLRHILNCPDKLRLQGMVANVCHPNTWELDHPGLSSS